MQSRAAVAWSTAGGRTRAHGGNKLRASSKMKQHFKYTSAPWLSLPLCNTRNTQRGLRRRRRLKSQWPGAHAFLLHHAHALPARQPRRFCAAGHPLPLVMARRFRATTLFAGKTHPRQPLQEGTAASACLRPHQHCPLRSRPPSRAARRMGGARRCAPRFASPSRRGGPQPSPRS